MCKVNGVARRGQGGVKEHVVMFTCGTFVNLSAISSVFYGFYR